SAGLIYHGVAVHRNADHIRELAGTLETKQERTPIKLSRTGKNVIVVMLDREVGAFFPYALEDMPYLREQYDGFTYYANSLSTGTTTTTGSPGLFGGHEYCGDAMMTDTGVPLAERHNEALKVLPVLFWQNGYHCIVAGLPFANYSDFPDMSIFDEYPDMDTYVFERELSMDRMTVDSEWNISSALFSYAIFKSAPYFYHDFLYNTVCYGLEQIPIEIPLEESYSVLANLPQMTVAVDEECGSFVEFDNNLVHEPALLQLPDYTITEKIDNTEYWAAMEDLSPMLRKLKTQGQYHVGAAALRLMGQWMDHLRELGVYDNTRIIIVSDHGANNLDFYPAVWGSDIGISNWDCILLYKDFNASGLTVCEDFMCNADVPYLATLGGVVKEAVNPFTGKPFTTAAMQNNTVTAVLPLEWAPVKGNAFTGYVYTVKEDMREAGTWQLMEQRY
ncbi:MAG: hypothetical protein IKO10_05365, partial [Lachnospiraceae bacterium]|nr:hypothetical protein [Lachnospiraceae bacterium]